MKVVLPERARKHLEGRLDGPEVAWYDDQESCLAAIGGAEVLWLDFVITGIDEIVRAGNDLRWVTTVGAGVERLPHRLLEQRGLIVTNGAGLGAIPISEYAVMGLLAGLKGFPELVRSQDKREWASPPSFNEMNGKRALIVGYGNIGRAIGDRLKPFGVKVTGVRRHPDREPDVIGADEWRKHLPETDLLILSVPLTGSTRMLVGEAELAALPDGAWVANIARGGLIDESALIAEMKKGRLGGAYLDVMSTEPLPLESELWSLPNVILTPHSSWASSHFLKRGAQLFLDNLTRYQQGQPLRNVVDLKAGY